MNTIKSVFDSHCSHLVFDKKLLKKVEEYEQRFATKNESHIAFFGGNLMGVHPIRFKDEDRNRWFDEVMEVDEHYLEDELHALPEVVTHRHVSSDVFNMSCLYMIHRFLTSDKLNEEDKHHGAFECALVLQYKHTTSIMTHFFKYDADPAIAEATYAALNNRFGLKVAGSWGALLRQRSEDIVRKGGLHYRNLVDFTDKIDYMSNDIQGRIKDIIKNVRDVFEMVKNNPAMQIRNASSTIELDGELKVRDKSRLTSKYVRYILDTVPDKNSFIVPEMVDLISSAVTTMPRSALVTTLTYMSENSSVRADKRIQRICELVLQHAFDYLAKNPTTMQSQSDVPGLLRKMRALYQASRTTNPMILELRELTEGVVSNAIRSKNQVLIASVRNAVLLYVLMRAWTMHRWRA